MYIIYFLLLFVPLLSTQENEETQSQYWIIAHPSALVLYNQYEQRISDPEKNELPEYSAWRIIEDNHVLSDQFTLTVKTELNHSIIYIQLSDEGEPLNKQQAGKIDIIKNARNQGDTLRVKTSGRVSMQRGSELIALSKGILIERLFRYRKKTFAKDISGNISGWIVGNASAHLENYIPEKSDPELEKQLYSRVDQIFISCNKRFIKLFSFLNDIYGTINPSPAWIAEKSSNYLKYTLTPSMYQSRFSQSQSFLVQELRDLLYGSMYQLSAAEGQIIILKNSK
jgi:hypothetical protein